MVLRMEPAESLVETSRLREFQMIRAMQGVVSVPPVFWCDRDGQYLPYPASFYGFAPGVAKPRNTVAGVSGGGTQVSPEIRRIPAPQFVQQLASIHKLDPRNAALSAFQIPLPGTHCAELGLDWWARVWEEDGDEEIPPICGCSTTVVNGAR
jgi:aminoglycoside phosphotransferase (APT) family kinase protein